MIYIYSAIDLTRFILFCNTGFPVSTYIDPSKPVPILLSKLCFHKEVIKPLLLCHNNQFVALAKWLEKSLSLTAVITCVQTPLKIH